MNTIDNQARASSLDQPVQSPASLSSDVILCRCGRKLGPRERVEQVFHVRCRGCHAVLAVTPTGSRFLNRHERRKLEVAGNLRWSQ